MVDVVKSFVRDTRETSVYHSVSRHLCTKRRSENTGDRHGRDSSSTAGTWSTNCCRSFYSTFEPFGRPPPTWSIAYVHKKKWKSVKTVVWTIPLVYWGWQTQLTLDVTLYKTLFFINKERATNRDTYTHVSRWNFYM